MKRSNAGYLALGALVSGLLLYVTLQRVKLDEVGPLLTAARPLFMLLGVGFLCLSYSMRGLRWRVLLAAEQPIPMGAVFRATMMGYLANNFLPARSGDVLKTLIIGQHANQTRSFVAATVVLERLIDVIALVLIAAVSLLALRLASGWLEPALRVMALLSGAGLVVLLLLARSDLALQKLVGHLTPLLGGRFDLAAVVERFAAGLRVLQRPGRLAAMLALTSGIWISDACYAISMSYALNAALTPPQAFLLLAALGLSSAAPSTPGYVGVYQFVAVSLLPLFALTEESALSYIILFQAMNYLVVLALNLPGLLTLLRRRFGSAG